MKIKFYNIFSCILILLCTFSFLQLHAEKHSTENENIPMEFKLFNSINNGDNIMISPISVEMMLMMVANGDVSENAKNEILNAYGINNFDNYKKSAYEFLSFMKKKNIADINNSIWYNENSEYFIDDFDKILPSGFDFFAEKYKVNKLNAVNRINNWVSKKTNGKINEIIDDAEFSSVVLNATYFKKDWEKPFNKHGTHKAIFNNKDGSTAYTDFMFNEDNYDYYENEKFQMVEIPYKSVNTSMYVFLPKKSINEFEYEWVNEGIGNKSSSYLTLRLPKFISGTKVSLKKSLEKLGMREMFYPNSLSGHHISEVLHKTFISVDEEGTEASAVTAGIVKCCLSPQVLINKPFTYIIRENESGKILFMGKQCKF